MFETIIIIIIALALGMVLLIYNGLVKSRNMVKEAWSGIDIQLKRRTDLIPNLVETVKGYAKHEKEVFENITKARTGLLQAQGPINSAVANDQLSQSLKTIFALVENYPQLKANQHFLDLQNELGNTEDRIAYSRQYYNSVVADFNNKIKTFPGIMFAGLFGFKVAEFFKAEDKDKEQRGISF